MRMDRISKVIAVTKLKSAVNLLRGSIERESIDDIGPVSALFRMRLAIKHCKFTIGLSPTIGLSRDCIIIICFKEISQ